MHRDVCTSIHKTVYQILYFLNICNIYQSEIPLLKSPTWPFWHPGKQVHRPRRSPSSSPTHPRCPRRSNLPSTPGSMFPVLPLVTHQTSKRVNIGSVYELRSWGFWVQLYSWSILAIHTYHHDGIGRRNVGYVTAMDVTKRSGNIIYICIYPDVTQVSYNRKNNINVHKQHNNHQQSLIFNIYMYFSQETFECPNLVSNTVTPQSPARELKSPNRQCRCKRHAHHDVPILEPCPPEMLERKRSF